MKRLLVVVDYQNDFVDGSLGFAGAEMLDSVITDKIKRYRADAQDVVFTQDTHYEDYLSTNEGIHLLVKHCICGTRGHEFYGETALNTGNSPVFEKNTFGSDKLFDYLREHRYDSVELCGLVLGICVLSNAILAKTALPEAEIIVDAAATAGNDRNFDLKVLGVLRGLQIEVLNFDGESVLPYENNKQAE